MAVWDDMAEHLAQLQRLGLRRAPRTVSSAPGARINVDGRSVVCLCSNDYLSLAAHPAVRAAAAEAIEQWGVGAGASRLVSGTTEAHLALERDLAAFKGTESAVVTSTGWQANRVAITALAGRGDLILCDKLNHASILDAATGSGARLRTYPHGDTDRLRQLLARRRGQYKRCLIVTDSLFSMDGDLAPLEALCDLEEAYDAQLLIDEAHATGVLGEHGRGAAELLGVEDRIDAVVGTLSKALGALGGFVAGPGVLTDTIRNTGRAYIYTTALPPAVCCAASAALAVVRAEPQRRRRLLELARSLRDRLRSAGLDTGDSTTQVMPVVLGSAERAVAVSEALWEAGFFVPAIRPPTVPHGTSRLRISLCADHAEEEITAFVAAVRRAASAV